MSLPHHQFPLEETRLIRVGRHTAYNGWSLWHYEEWTRDDQRLPGKWVSKVLASQGHEVLFPVVGSNIRRMVDEVVAQRTQMEKDLSNILVKEGAPTGLAGFA